MRRQSLHLLSAVLKCSAPSSRRHATTGISRFSSATTTTILNPSLNSTALLHTGEKPSLTACIQCRKASTKLVVRRQPVIKDPIEILLDAPPTAAELHQHDYFGVRNLATIRDLFLARVHFGHTIGTLDTKMAHYIFGKRLDICIFDLNKTHKLLGDALNVLAHIVYRGGLVLFISRNRFHTHLIETVAREAGEYSHCRYWTGGTVSNADQVFGSLTRLPDVIVFLSTHNSILAPHRAIVEASLMNIPVIAIVDSNSSPDLITYPIPANDDSISAIALYCQIFKQAILRAKEFRKRDDANDTTSTDATDAVAHEVGDISTTRFPVEPSGRAGSVDEQYEIPPDENVSFHHDDGVDAAAGDSANTRPPY